MSETCSLMRVCPDSETLAAYMEGRLNLADRSRVEAHLATCEDCYEAVVEIVHANALAPSVSVQSMVASPASRRRPTRWLWLAATAAVLTFVVGSVWIRTRTSIPTAITALDRAAGSNRLAYGRLSVLTTWAPAPSVTRGAGGKLESLALREAADRLERAAGDDRTQQALHARALALLVHDQLDDAVSALEGAIVVGGNDDVGLRTDLAAILLERHRRSGATSDAVRALDEASRALARVPGSPQALFNRALALEAIGPVSIAFDAWNAYLQVDSGSKWADEARTHQSALRSRRSSSAPPPGETFARAEAALLHWADVTLAGPPQPDSTVDTAGLPGSDQLLVDQAAAVRRSMAWTAARRRCLAEGLRALARWRADYDEAEVIDARNSALEAETALQCAGVSTLPAAIGSALTEDRVLVFSRLDALAQAAEDHGYVRLAALVRISRGNTALRLTSFDAGLTELMRARTLAMRGGDDELAGTAVAMIADAYRQQGSWPRVNDAVRDSLAAFDDFRSPRLSYSVARAAADAMLAQSLQGAALVYAGLVVQSTRAWSNPGGRVLALIKQALAERALGLTLNVDERMGTARSLLEGIRDPSLREEFEAEIDLASGQLDERTNPARAVGRLSAAIGFFERRNAPIRLAEVLLHRGRAFETLHQLSKAEDDWQRGANAIVAQQKTIRNEGLRISRLSGAWDTFDELLRDARRNPAILFQVAESSRSVELYGALEGARADVAVGPAAWRWLPPQVSALVYTVLPDELLILHVTQEGPTLITVALSRDRLSFEVREALRRLARGDADALDALSAILLPPGAVSASALLIVPDGPLHAVPFHALVTDLRGRRRLVQETVPIVTPTIGVARVLTDRLREPARALLVGYGDANAIEGLPRLPDVEREIDAIASLYPGAQVLTGRLATPAAVAGASRESGVIHIASHAIINQVSPGLSGLVLAPQPDTAVLSAAAIAATMLNHHPVVVLAACDTMAGQTFHGEGVLNLARPYLLAGATAVIGALWPARDAAAVRLMTDVHTRLAGGESAAQSLAEVQRSAIASGVPVADWATFAVIGGLPEFVGKLPVSHPLTIGDHRR